MAYIEFKNVIKEYYIEEDTKIILKNVNFKIKKGEITLIKGINGSGKTTLLNLIASFDKATNGDILVDKISLRTLKGKNSSKYIREYIGFVSYDNELINDMTILENTILSLNISKKEFDTENYIENLGLEDKLNYFPFELSESERIKASLLCAICKNPKVLLCDEIFLKMNEKDKKQVIKVLKELASKSKITILITADEDSNFSFVKQTLTLKDGEIKTNKSPTKAKTARKITTKAKAKAKGGKK